MNCAHFTEAEINFLNRSRVARFATADSTGQPHVIPIVFATDGEKLYTPVDRKRKRLAPAQLKRVRNLSENPKIAFIVDHYNEDWNQLAWLLVKGTGKVVESGEAHSSGMRLLQEKYAQYERMPLANRPLIVITPLQITSWKAAEG